MTDTSPDVLPPAVLPTEFQDEVPQIFASERATGRLYVVLDFAVLLEADRLRLATRRLLDAEPVLGCRFDDSEAVPVWRRRADLDADPGFVLQEAVTDIDSETVAVVAAEFDAVQSRNVTVHLLRHGAGDRLILGVSHVVADGGAVLLVLERFAALYTGLAGDPAFRLPANTAPRDSFRWMADFSLRDRLKLLWRDLRDAPRMARGQQGFQRPYETFAAAPRRRPGLAKVTISAERLALIDAAAKARGLSRNDMLLAGFARAFIDFCHGDPRRSLQIVMPIDMRRYAAVESRPAICNLGGIANVFIAPGLGDGFADTLGRVAREMERHRGSFMGAPNPFAAKLFSGMTFARKRRAIARLMQKGMNKPAPPTFTNLGQIRERRLRFGDQSPDSVTLYSMPLSSPLVVVAATEYRRVMTLTMSYDLDDHSADDVARFLTAIAAGIALQP
jgi:NRPS condensation-like uncharacterized protein